MNFTAGTTLAALFGGQEFLPDLNRTTAASFVQYNESADAFSPNETDIHNPHANLSYEELILNTFGPKRDPYYVVIPITIIYLLIFITGVIGNISTCIVISKNKSMHTATNYYLFSLAISDFLLLMSGVPQEMYVIWSKYPYIFGELFCIIRGLAAETAANATVLTITAFTIERYVAICHPFLSHTMSKLSRAIRLIVLIWLISICFAIPQALQFGVKEMYGIDYCTVTTEIIQHSFELSTFLFFFAPMTLITVLYILIGLKLRSPTLMKRESGGPLHRRNHVNSSSMTSRQQNNQGTKRVLKMLVAVVVAFFICWAPFHAQRLVYIYGTDETGQLTFNTIISKIFTIMTYVSGILYYLSTCVNPLLYNIMSHKFREAFKETLARCCSLSKHKDHKKRRAYRILSRGQRRLCGKQESPEYSGNTMSVKDDSMYSSFTQKQTLESITVCRGSASQSFKRKSLQQSARNELSIFSRVVGNDPTTGGTHMCVGAGGGVGKAPKDDNCATTSVDSSSTPPSTSLQLQIDDIFINSIQLHSNNSEILNYDLMSQDSLSGYHMEGDRATGRGAVLNNVNVIYKNNRKGPGSEIHIYLSRRASGKKLSSDLQCGGVSQRKLRLWKCLHPIRLKEKKSKNICGFYSPPLAKSASRRESLQRGPELLQHVQQSSWLPQHNDKGQMAQPKCPYHTNESSGADNVYNIGNFNEFHGNSINCDHYNNKNLIKNLNYNCNCTCNNNSFNNNNNCNVNVNDVNDDNEHNNHDEENSLNEIDLYAREDELEAYMNEIKRREIS